jgi:multisubunit Na+/H+ antiporter MnhC subunit
MRKESAQSDIESIRQLMERSVKFVSLSGLSGILAGVYALLGAGYAYQQIYSGEEFRSVEFYRGTIPIVQNLLTTAIVVLVASLATGWWFSQRKAKKMGTTIWNATSRRLLINLAIPLATGGFFTLVLLYHGYFNLVGAAVLIFYGLALINASSSLFEEVRYLGYSELVVGMVAAIYPGYALFMWAFGFGVLHIVYGSLMYNKYDRH